MRIFMWVNYNTDDLSLGFSRKIRAQIDALRQMGHTVVYSAYTEDGAAIYDNNDSMIASGKLYMPVKKIRRKAKFFYLTHFILKYLEKSNETYDLAIIRWATLSDGVVKNLRALRKKCKYTVMDAHGYFKSMKGKKLEGKFIVKKTNQNQHYMPELLDLVLTETDEKEIFGVPAVKYDNGVDTRNIKPLEYDGPADELNLISVGNERIYHGYDRVIKSMHDYQGSYKIRLHLVGTVSNETRKLIQNLGMEKSVVLYGKLFGEKLDQAYDHGNLGVGPVGQHRTGGKQGTGLKTKEYFAKGLPYIYSGNELLVEGDYPYILKVPSDESMLDFDKIIAFHKKIDMKQACADMRDFAMKHYTWEKVFNDMFQALPEK